MIVVLLLRSPLCLTPHPHNLSLSLARASGGRLSHYSTIQSAHTNGYIYARARLGRANIINFNPARAVHAHTADGRTRAHIHVQRIQDTHRYKFSFNAVRNRKLGRERERGAPERQPFSAYIAGIWGRTRDGGPPKADLVHATRARARLYHSCCVVATLSWNRIISRSVPCLCVYTYA